MNRFLSSLTAFLFFAFLLATMQAAELTSTEILAAAKAWIEGNAVFQLEQPDAVPVNAVRMTDADGAARPLWRVNLEPAGYLVMAADDFLPPVVAFAMSVLK